MQEDTTRGKSSNATNRRNVLKLISGAATVGLATSVVATTSSKAQTDIRLPSSPFTDSDNDTYSGSDTKGSLWYTEYRGFMNSACTRVSKINTDDGRVFHEISTCCTSEFQRKHRINGWDKGYLLGGSAVKFDFPDHQVLEPQDAENANEWIGSSVTGTKNMADGVSDEAEAVFNLLVNISPYADVKSFSDFWNAIAAAKQSGDDYDYKWGDVPTPTYEDLYKVHHWIKILVEEKEEDPAVAGEIEHTAFGGALTNKVHTLTIDADSTSVLSTSLEKTGEDANSTSVQSNSLEKPDEETIKEKKDLLESVGYSDVTIESVQVKR